MHYKTAAGIQKIAGILRGLRKVAEDKKSEGVDTSLQSYLDAVARTPTSSKNPVSKPYTEYLVDLNKEPVKSLEALRAEQAHGNAFNMTVYAEPRQSLEYAATKVGEAKRVLHNMGIDVSKLPDSFYEKFYPYDWPKEDHDAVIDMFKQQVRRKPLKPATTFVG